jgi:TPR repeat protein
VALGGTFDPIAFAKLGVAGLRADVEKARTWYQKAESLSNTAAGHSCKS